MAFLKRQKNLVVRDWKENKITLVQYPRAAVIPSISPWSLKMETWLRFVQLDYTASFCLPFNVSNDFQQASTKGQVPFVEVNGRQIADSNFIIDQLKTMFNLSIDRDLEPRPGRQRTRLPRAHRRESAAFFHRSKDMSWLVTDKGVLGHFQGIKKTVFEKLIVKKAQHNIKNICNVQGIGRHSGAEVDEIAKKDLNALSHLLGDKHYFFGEYPSTLDATAFGTLAEILYTPLKGTLIKDYLVNSTPNLVQLIERIKANFWPDWDILTSKLVMNRHEAELPHSEPAAAPAATTA
ncbi:hypothetical protein M3Y99_01898100 [Aphelenchoides fujianensis]|nr:hypothetical protein M3Y99_01898100 [Aphelenchoides fujianensis]